MDVRWYDIDGQDVGQRVGCYGRENKSHNKCRAVYTEIGLFLNYNFIPEYTSTVNVTLLVGT